MPREHKQRGRRAEKKRKLDDQDVEDYSDSESKRQRIEHVDEAPLAYEVDTTGEQPGFTQDPTTQADLPEQVFYGMLDEEEQEYFRRANEVIELNDFAGTEERQLFVDNLFREAAHKELKLANSQSGSRLLERLLQLAAPAQLKNLFNKFVGQFSNLIQHRFASHCCERLFILCAPIVTQEYLHPPKHGKTNPDQPFVSMESLFLSTVTELQGNVGFLMTDRFATHTLRVLLLVLAGESADSPLMKAILQSKKKEDVKVSSSGTKPDTESAPAKLSVPQSFTDALSDLIRASVAGLDTTNLRALAKHEQANPMLQLLLRIELTHFGKSRGKEQDSIVRRLLPDDTITPESETAIFLNDLIYDSIGSHLVETIVEFAPAKIFKNLFQQFYKERIASLARNEIASYVVCKALERLSRDDLIAVHGTLIPALPRLLELNRVNVIRTLIERCAVRKIETQAIAVQLQSIFDNGSGFDILRFLHFEDASTASDSTNIAPPISSHDTSQINNEIDTARTPSRRPPPSQSELQSNLLAQALILSPGPLSSLILDSLPIIPIPTLLTLATTPTSSRTLQAALTSVNASIISRRKLVQQFYGHAASLSLDPIGSRVVDSIWDGTYGLAFIRERFAEELSEREADLRESVSGRAVWRNWSMDLWKRRRGEWIKRSRWRASDDGFQHWEVLERNKEEAGRSRKEYGSGQDKRDGHGPDGKDKRSGNGRGARIGAEKADVNGFQQAQAAGRKKTPLELARERHANKKAAAGAAQARMGNSVEADEAGKRRKAAVM